MKRFISFSGGVESTTMALMFGHDATPIFADTGWEHPEMYARLDDVEGKLQAIHGEDFEVVRIRPEETLQAYIERSRFFPSPRARFCTRIFKIEPMNDFLEEYGECELMIGLNADEKEKRTGNHGLLDHVSYTYPLADLGITRADCLSVLNEYGLAPRLPVYMRRGGCVGCFYKSKEEYRAMVHLARAQIEGVAALEGSIQGKAGGHYGVRDGIKSMREFIDEEAMAFLSPEEMYPSLTVDSNAPCGVFCHR